MPENPNPKPGPLPRRRYRTRMFDNQLSFPTTSEQVRALQAASDAERRSVASLVREAIDQFLPRLRKRRQTRTGRGFKKKAKHLLGDPDQRTAQEWRYGSLRIDLETGLWKDSETGKGGYFLELIQRTLQTDQAGALNWVDRLREEPPE